MQSGDSISEIECTSLDRDWGDERPNLLMHPPCVCPRCAPQTETLEDDGKQWLTVSGERQRFRVEPAELGELGKATLG